MVQEWERGKEWETGRDKERGESPLGRVGGGMLALTWALAWALVWALAWGTVLALASDASRARLRRR